MMLLGALSALLIVGLLTGGMWAWWLVVRRLPRPRHPSGRGRDAQAALWRHPAGRERWVEPDGLRALIQPDVPSPGQPTGPEDDPEFISALERLIRGEDPGGPGGPA
jgi:hypothetical protein